MNDIKTGQPKKGRLLFYLSFCALVAFGILYSCTKEGITEKETAQNDIDFEELLKIPEVLNGFTMEGMAIPDGTAARMISNSEVELTFPNGILLAQIFPQNGTYFASARKSYTCTCSGTGCDVFNGGGVVGCSSCTKKCTGEWKGGNEQRLSNMGDNPLLEEEIKYFIDLEQGVQHITGEELKLLSPAPTYLLNLKEVEKVYEEFLSSNFGISSLDLRRAETSPNDFGVIPVNYFGYAASLIVPIQYSKTPLTSYSNSRGPGCDCSSGSTGCTGETIRHRGFKVGFKCSAGGCTSCTMTNIE